MNIGEWPSLIAVTCSLIIENSIYYYSIVVNQENKDAKKIKRKKKTFWTLLFVKIGFAIFGLIMIFTDEPVLALRSYSLFFSYYVVVGLAGLVMCFILLERLWNRLFKRNSQHQQQ